MTRNICPADHAATLLNLIENFSETGSWAWTPEHNQISWSASLFRILGLNAVHTVSSWELLESIVHPDDLTPGGSYDRPLPCHELQDRRFRIIRPGGGIRWLRMVSGLAIRALHTPGCVVGVAFDVTTSIDEGRSTTHGNSGPLSAAQVRAARGLLDWSAMELAERAGVSFSTIRRIEMPEPRAVREENLRAARATLERHGAEFIVLADGRPGLALKG